MDKHLHIVSFDVPYPADYGGVIDVFYKIVWLHKQGVKIHLHCFTKGREPQPELEKYCVSVHYYPRKTGLRGFSLTLPYIVSSRKSHKLLTNLAKDNYPILFEGVHTTYWLHKNKFPNRQVFIRIHNVEHQYYTQLAKIERNFFKRCYYKLEATALKNYERQTASKGILLTLSTNDQQLYLKEFAAQQVHELPVFTPWNEVESVVGGVPFCMYHGNLSVNENEKSALWLVEKVFVPLNISMMILGKSPSAYLVSQLKKYPQISLEINPTDATIHECLQHVLINALPSFNNTGVKLKLLNALYNSRYCVVNSAGVKGSGLEELCTIADTEEEFKTAIQTLIQRPFTQEDIEHKKAVLYEKYSNQKNAELFIKLLH
ncbi:mannosyltransferase [Ferruginibacter sp. HRS2-29]|uniref:mannosyltransferase n=1 Tax=Ferruginibacter sp. HRS2-29 TaxID=2487334 RepID=UPI0020CF8DC1|nr:mannosyltransferase [Ferruginibacter sp. HRS2-29]MCP9751377.1 mannosyltransferase [Ferruginibacter sp. HRS2-29]